MKIYMANYVRVMHLPSCAMCMKTCESPEYMTRCATKEFDAAGRICMPENCDFYCDGIHNIKDDAVSRHYENIRMKL